MIKVYDPSLHEMLAVKWFCDLRQKPDEFEKLFMAPLRQLTPFLAWAATVKVIIDFDQQGISKAAWVEPMMSGAFFGAWMREDVRGTFGALGFIRKAYKWAFEMYPVLIGITKQPELEKVHLALGYEKMEPKIPHLFDGQDAWVYILERGNFYGCRRRQDEQRKLNGKHELPRPVLREDSGTGVENHSTDLPNAGGTDQPSAFDGWGEREHPGDKLKTRKRKNGRKHQRPEPEGRPVEVGPHQ